MTTNLSGERIPSSESSSSFHTELREIGVGASGTNRMAEHKARGGNTKL